MSFLKSLYSAKYFLIFVFILLFTVLCSVYTYVHESNPNHQGRVSELESEQKDAIKAIYSGTESQSLVNFNMYEDSALLKSPIYHTNSTQSKKALEQKAKRINKYLSSIGLKTQFTVDELPFVVTYLNDMTVEAKSYFFLKDLWVLLEILMWALMGVICNSLYHMSEYIRKGEFDSSETIVYFVKLFYAPIIVLVIFLGIEFLGQDSGLLKPTPANTIVLSFILGFFSGRAVELLNRIKNAFFPANSITNQSEIATNEKNEESPFLALEESEQERVVNEFINACASDLVEKYPEIQGFSSEHNNGNLSEPLCISIDVKSKKPQQELSNLIPPFFSFSDSKGTIYDIPTDIVEVGTYQTLDEGRFIGHKEMPKKLGLSCSRQGSNSTGTIGLKVFKNGVPHLLSCFHVLCSKELEAKSTTYNKNSNPDYVISPSEKDRDKEKHPQIIGEVSDGVLNHYVDAAIAKLSNPSILENKYFDNSGFPKGIRKLSSIDKQNKIWLKIVGRTSGVKWGRLINNYTNRVYITQYKEVLERGELRDVIIAEGFSNAGDSGATVLDSDSNVIGILTAGNSKSKSIIIPIHTIINHLQLDEPFQL